MPTKLHGKHTRVYMNGFDISNYFNNAESTFTNDVAESSGFGDEDKTYEVGLGDGSARLQGQFDTRGGDEGTETRLRAVLAAATNPILNIVRQDALNAGGDGGEDIMTNISVASPIAGIIAMNAEFKATGGLRRLLTVVPKSFGTVTGTVTPTAEYNGGAETVWGATAFLQCFEVVSGTPVLKIRHADAVGGAWSDLITFAAIDPLLAPQAQVVEIAGTVSPFLSAEIEDGEAVVYIGINQPIN